jgi:hypothetical protein
VELLRERRTRGHRHEGEEAVQFLGGRDDELAVEAEYVGRVLQMPERRAGDDGADGVKPERERGDNAEVAAASQRPVEVVVSVRAGLDEAAVSQHHVGLENVVDGQAGTS